MQVPLFYHPRPVFGLDIGRSTIKVAQVKAQKSQVRVVSYGYARFSSTATKDGELIKPEIVAQAIRSLLADSTIGKLTGHRVVASVPIANIYTRILQLPKLTSKDLAEAVKLEAEQYVPLAAEELYIEQLVLPSPKSAKATATQPVLMVATPRKIVNSYLAVFEQLGLEATVLEPNMFANLRVADYAVPHPGSKIIIDFGARSSDMAVYAGGGWQLISTIGTGGDNITEQIAQTLKLAPEQANQLKVHYGIGRSRWQAQLAAALQPILSDFANEVQKMVRYYHDHNPGQGAVDQIILVGGGANMPGLSDFLAHLTGIAVVICNPWTKLVVAPLQPPSTSETTVFATAVGLALKELDHD
ncbi:type IV pilus assembly protein PilM [Candidatus Microgenomates bacterium]|nr:type IV pilus assembly protein PilM [Candidatus Microgenomates bacterium]